MQGGSRPKMGTVPRQMWTDMPEPVSLEEHAGVLPGDSVTVTDERKPGKGDDWEVRAYFTVPGQVLGYTARPLPAAHMGFKVYRGDRFQYSLDAGPDWFKKGGSGNLRFSGEPADLDENNSGITRLGEVRIVPPKGVSGEEFARQLGQAAYDYDGSLPYSFPLKMAPLPSTIGEPDPKPWLPIYPGNTMNPGEYNSDSFAAGVLERVGAGFNIPVIQQHLAKKNGPRRVLSNRCRSGIFAGVDRQG